MVGYTRSLGHGGVGRRSANGEPIKLADGTPVMGRACPPRSTGSRDGRGPQALDRPARPFPEPAFVGRSTPQASACRG